MNNIKVYQAHKESVRGLSLVFILKEEESLLI